MNKKRILFVCSAGGHFSELLELEDLILNNDSIIITEQNIAYNDLNTKYNLKYVLPAGKGRDFTYWKNFVINIFTSIKILIKFKPEFIISTGSHTAIPYFIFGTLIKCKRIFILSYALINTSSKSANLIYKFSDLFIVQWESAQRNYPKSKYLGGALF